VCSLRAPHQRSSYRLEAATEHLVAWRQRSAAATFGTRAVLTATARLAPRLAIEAGPPGNRTAELGMTWVAEAASSQEQMAIGTAGLGGDDLFSQGAGCVMCGMPSCATWLGATCMPLVLPSSALQHDIDRSIGNMWPRMCCSEHAATQIIESARRACQHGGGSQQWQASNRVVSVVMRADAIDHSAIDRRGKHLSAGSS
jgi:hypothetical protein